MLSLLQVAARYATLPQDRRSYLIGAIGLRYDGGRVHAANGPVDVASYDAGVNAHAEHRLVRKLDRGSVVYVARVRRSDGGLALAKPCQTCERTLRLRGVVRVYYTISEREYGVLEL